MSDSPPSDDPSSSHDQEEDHQTLSHDVAYETRLRLERKRRADALPVVPLPPRVIGGLRDQMTKARTCNCRRSNCLKLYCDCFQGGIHCTPGLCNCVSCQNLPGEENRSTQLFSTIDRNANAFRPKLLSLGLGEGQKEEVTNKSKLGCSCKKTNCLKKYCDCFHASVSCSAYQCSCINCRNYEGSITRDVLQAKRRRRQEAAAAALTSREESGVAFDGDAFLPPLTYAIPVKLPSGVAFPALSFGSTNLAQATNPISVVIEVKDDDERKRPAQAIYPADGNKKTPANTAGASKKRPGSAALSVTGRFTEMEAAWNTETLKVGQAFASMRKVARTRRGEDPGRKHANNACQIAGTKLFSSIEKDMKRVVNAINKAERDTVAHLDSKAKAGPASDPAVEATGSHLKDGEALECSAVADAHEAALLCQEVLDADPNDTELSKAAIRELTILAAQDAALLRELTSIIRQKTLSITKIRLRESQQTVERL